MDDLECDICCYGYNEENHRPLVLKCGHTYCKQCMTKEITEGKTLCPTCRRPHKAKSVDDLILNITVQRLIRNTMENIVDTNTHVTEDEAEEDESNGGRCSIHNKSDLYFYCETHSLKICRECTVLDHEVSKCKIISFKVMVERKKENAITQLDSNIKAMNATLSTLAEFAKERVAIIKKNEIKIHKLKEDLNAAEEVISKEKSAGEKAQAEITYGNTKLQEIMSAKEEMQNAMTKKKINKSFNDIASKSKNTTKWIENVREKLDLPHKVKVALEARCGNVGTTGAGVAGPPAVKRTRSSASRLVQPRRY